MFKNCNLPLLNILEDLVFVIDSNFKIVSVNDAVTEKLGYDANYLVGKDVLEIHKNINHLDVDKFLERIKKLPDNMVMNMEKRNGEKIRVKTKFSKIKTECEDEEFVILVAKDINDILEKNELLENYKSLLDSIPDLMVRINENGFIIDIKQGNSIYSKVGESSKFIGKNVKDLPFDSVIINEILICIREVIEIGEPVEYCYTVNINGKDRKYYFRTVRSKRKEVITLIRDITEEMLVERELMNSRDFAENLINTANAMIVGLDLDGKINIFNNAAEEMTGYSKNEVMGKSWFSNIPILPKDEIDRIKNVFERTINEDESTNIVENPIITKHGEIKYILWQNNEVKENGITIGTISFGLDITDRKKYEETLIKERNEAEKADQMKLEFLSNMSHDLRTPMNVIIGFSDLLRTNNLSRTERNDYINTILNNGKFLMALIDDIIDISKIDAGSLKIDPRPFELNKLMDETRLTYLKQIKDKNIDIILDIDINKNIIIDSDKYRLRQILTNLVGNAIKFTKKGYVKFGYTTINDKQIMIYVEDTGPGIDKSDQEIIFERFKQVGIRDGDKFKGAGLGLAITKSLIELLGFKEINLRSEVGKGSKFYFIVPYTIKRFEYLSEIKNRKHKKINFSGKKILIVEDDADNRMIMKSYLSNTRSKIIECVDGHDVINIIKQEKIDLVLLDIGLPNKNGYDILKEIRNYDDRLPVIVESALTMPDQKSKAYDYGCDDFISKPFNREDFLNKIDKLI